jgi:hypothetical protein
MADPISAELRRLVASRARHVCEYCLIHADDVYVGLQMDHVISEKHGGATSAENLALACANCNRRKGSDIGSVDPVTGRLVRLFNPRTDLWSDHFRLVGIRIEWRTPVGEATVRVLKLNDSLRIEERETLKQNGKYPSPEALERIRSL